jgi:ribosomal protein S18 acetylase RimI-like enzyme
MHTRGITRDDYQQIVSVTDRWWGGPTAALALPLFYYEFGRHARIVEENGQLVGFLLGFVTSDVPREGYVHLVGIDPEYRRRGVGKQLYAEFAQHARDAGAVRIKAITTPGNQGSIDFHVALGFAAERVTDYAGPGRDRFVFTRDL